MTHDTHASDEHEEPPVSLDGLARHMPPPPHLEGQVVGELTRAGLLRRRRPAFRPGWALAAAVAGLAVFLAGFTAGQRTGSRATLETVLALQEGDAAQRAAHLQYTGSLYVQAMNALGVGSPDSGATQGQEVALATLRAAVAELVRLNPDDTRLRQVLDLLAPTPVQPGQPAEARTVLWF